MPVDPDVLAVRVLRSESPSSRNVLTLIGGTIGRNESGVLTPECVPMSCGVSEAPE